MGALVFGKVGAGTEVFPTVRALERLHSCVDSLMDTEVGTLGKSLPTGQALERLLSSVGSLMIDKVCFANEGFPTVRAPVLLPFPMSSFTRNGVRDHLEAFPTIRAFVGLLHCVGSLTFNRVCPLPEAPSINLEHALLLWHVDPLCFPAFLKEFITLPNHTCFCSLWWAIFLFRLRVVLFLLTKT